MKLSPSVSVGGHSSSNLHSFWDGGAGQSGLEDVGYVSPSPPGESGVNQAQLGAFVDGVVVSA